MIDYKDTLNLPSTDFPMKANLPQREPAMLEHWESMGIYGKMLDKNRPGGRSYILHDGPPYANGHIHIGHALNKVLKDMIVKYKAMQGYYAPYVPGWDCHGLPIELEVDKKLGSRKEGMGILDVRRECREYATKFIDIQREEFKRLGVFGAWDDPYLTMTPRYQGAIAGELLTFVRKGYVYKGRKPVHWCSSCVTALAEAEVEYADKTSPSVFVRFEACDALRDKLGLGGRRLYIVIWTTTPWTLPANLALAVGPEIEYVALEGEDGAAYVVARALKDALITSLPLKDNVLAACSGADLAGDGSFTARHPFIERDSKLIAADFVSTEDGSGVVHIAPGHGEDDYRAGLANGLEILVPVDDGGKFKNSGVEAIEGLFVYKANPVIIEMMRESGALLEARDIRHSYPHCWRCKRPVIFRATEQWFISMSHDNLRGRALEEVARVEWIPSWGEERIRGMVEGRPDWCVSRQRSWGVPITVFSCDACGRMVDDPEILDKTGALIMEKGADVWYTDEATALMPKGYTCKGCGGSEFRREMDILDVWFDSGVSHAATLTEDRGLTWPADMYLEGQDQYRGWFQSSLLASVGSRGSAPYRAVLTHGFTVDKEGKKMSKSKGNVIAPQDIIKQMGAEILRLWVSAEDYRSDIKISNEIMARLTEAYRKIRNTSKFILGNLGDYPGGDYSAHMTELDRWAMSRLQGLVEKVTRAYDNYAFHEVYHRLHNFCVVDMSNFYLDILKDRLYTFGANDPERRAAQWVLAEILGAMTRLMAPVLSFTAEEVWSHMPGKDAESVFLSVFPVADPKYVDMGLEARWARLKTVRDEVNKALELRRAEKFIGNSLEAGVVIHAPEAEMGLLEERREILPTLFIVSAAELAQVPVEGYESAELPGLSVRVERAPGHKCPRCWNRSEAIAEDGGICPRCSEAIR